MCSHREKKIDFSKLRELANDINRMTADEKSSYYPQQTSEELDNQEEDKDNSQAIL